jgi:quercetin dioxygenase-like cupin family protein
LCQKPLTSNLGALGRINNRRNFQTADSREEKESDMKRKVTALVLLSAAILVAAFYVRNARATTATGFVGTTLAVGRFGEIDVFNHLIPPNFFHDRHKSDIWLSWQKTKGASDVYVQSNVWAPGGSTGWHTHPGHSLIVVTAGAVTAYEGDDPDCKPTVYTQGMGFVDPGGDHVHNIRNEGGIEARTIAVQLIPADAVRRIDAENPGHCPF